MQKVLIIIALFILAIFVIYQINEYEESTFVHSVTETKVKYKVLSEKTEQFKAEKKIVLEEQNLSVDIGVDKNVSRDTEVTLSATVQNVKNLYACNYFWRENGEIIGTGSSISVSFSKGEHIVNLQVLDSEGQEASDSIKITAWDYYIVKNKYYSPVTGEFMREGLEVYDHNGNYLLLDDGSFSKYTFLYNDEGREIEMSTEYYNYPEENRKKFYTYDDNGNIATIELLNADDVMVSFQTYEYDEDGNQVSSKSGVDQETLVEDEVYAYIDPYEDRNSTYRDNSPSPITRYNENNQTIYNEIDYNYLKVIYEYSYNKDGTLIKDISTTISGEESESRITNYNENGNNTNSEILYKKDDETICHYEIELTYNIDGHISTRGKKVLEGDCSNRVNPEHSSYRYDGRGNIIEIKSKSFIEDDYSEEYTTLKTFRFYSNELEE